MTPTADVVSQLVSGPVNELPSASPPNREGFYAWWTHPEPLSLATPPIPLVSFESLGPGWSLLYVGLAPNSATSRRRIATRLAVDHLTGTIGNSTFRQSLAALLRRHLDLRPKAGHDRSRLMSEVALSAWIEKHCGLTWAKWDRPWQPGLEKAVISELRRGALEARSRAEEAEADFSAKLQQAAAALVAVKGVRDAGELLHLSHGRIHQLVAYAGARTRQAFEDQAAPKPKSPATRRAPAPPKGRRPR